MTYMSTPLHKDPCPRGHEIYNFDKPFLGHHNFAFSLSVICLRVETKIFKEIMHFHYITYIATPLHKSPCPRGHELYNFSRPFLGHYNYILRLSVLFLGVEKKILKEIMLLRYMTYMATLLHKNPCPGGHEIYNLVDPSLLIITIHLICMYHAPQ